MTNEERIAKHIKKGMTKSQAARLVRKQNRINGIAERKRLRQIEHEKSQTKQESI